MRSHPFTTSGLRKYCCRLQNNKPFSLFITLKITYNCKLESHYRNLEVSTEGRSDRNSLFSGEEMNKVHPKRSMH